MGSIPPTAKGRMVRARLLAASRKVFERDGFLSARVTDIAEAAGVGHGTFYRYFASKTDVFRDLMAETVDSIYTSIVDTQAGEPPDPVARIERSNRRFVETYRANAALMGLFEQATTFDHEIRDLRIAVRRRMVQRVKRSIEDMQDAGAIPRDFDAEYAANALIAMVNSTVHLWLVLGEDFDPEKIVQTLTLVWARGIGLEVPPGGGR